MAVASDRLFASGALLAHQVPNAVSFLEANTLQGVTHQLGLVAGIACQCFGRQVEITADVLFVIYCPAHGGGSTDGTDAGGLSVLYCQVVVFAQTQFRQRLGIDRHRGPKLFG